MNDTQNQFDFFGIKIIPDFKLGEVIEIKTTSETHVTGGGGGSLSGKYIAPVHISSYTYTRSKIWVKTPDGIEEEWVIPGDVSARQNHKLALISLLAEKEGIKFILLNLTTGNAIPISTPDEVASTFKVSKTVKKLPYILMFFFIPFVGLLSPILYFFNKSKAGKRKIQACAVLDQVQKDLISVAYNKYTQL